MHPNNTNTPLFLYIPFSAPHTPLQAPDKYAKRCSEVTTDSGSNIRQLLCMMIAAVDDAVGEVVAALHRKNMYKDTIFIYASDNGGIEGSNVGGFNGYKGSFLEGGVRIPSFIGGAPISEGNSSGLLFDGMTHLTDIFATVMDIAGIDQSSYFSDGKSLLNGTQLNPEFHRSEVHLGYMDYAYNGNGFGVVLESNGFYWKYTYRPNTAESLKGYGTLRNDVYLFDLTNDPTESQNLLDVDSELREIAENSIPMFLDMAVSQNPSKNLRTSVELLSIPNKSYKKLARNALNQGITMVDEIKAYSIPFQTEIDGYIWQLQKYQPTDKGCWYPQTGPDADMDCYLTNQYDPSDNFLKHIYPL
mmetsp:Transcript_82261/g.229287  ORF Transcript_82261/g.229287 Transcript_82261/m.229287 type:complete len:359 (+) Transcript_82261:1-1077(+)